MGKKLPAPESGWAAKSLPSKILWSTLKPATSAIWWSALPITSKISYTATPITYKSKLEDHKFYDHCYKFLTGTSALLGLSSSVTGWVFGPINQVIGITTAGVGFFTGVKGIYENNQKLKFYSDMHNTTVEKVYFAVSNIKDFTYFTITNPQGFDCLADKKYIQGTSPKFVSNILTFLPQLFPDGKGNFNEGMKIIEEDHRQAMLSKRGNMSDSNYYSQDMCSSIVVPSLSQTVRNKLEEEFSPALVEAAQKFTDTDSYIENNLENYKNSIKDKLLYKFYSKEDAITNKVEELKAQATQLQDIKNRGAEILREYSNNHSQEDYNNNPENSDTDAYYPSSGHNHHNTNSIYYEATNNLENSDTDVHYPSSGHDHHNTNSIIDHEYHEVERAGEVWLEHGEAGAAAA
ncbi:unnamed protein product [Rotaria sordida]|nr:unnamed protein product [Rotaria sordida]